MKIKSIHLEDHPFLGTVDIDFTGPGGKPLDTIVLAGINGSGKTTLLETIFQIMTHVEKKYPITFEIELDLSHIEPGSIIRSSHKPGGEPNIYWNSFLKMEIDNHNRPKIIKMPTEINLDGLKTKSQSFSYTYKFINIVDRHTLDDIPSFLATRVNDEVYKNPDLPPKASIEKVCEEINSIFDILDIEAKMVGLNPEGEKLPIFKNTMGKTFNINGLSSGEKQLFVRALSLKMIQANNSVILIDEPEISLHPTWQQRIMGVYEKIGHNNQVIAATHSPHVVSSVKKESLKLLKIEGGKIVVVDHQDINGSLGLPVDMVLRELMELKSVRDPKVAGELRDLWDMVKAQNHETPEFTGKYNELESLLGSEDEDLLLMRIEIARLKGEKEKHSAENR
jgi:energy-coupling factor transporter ATP-binding protein EcfA2